MAAFERKLVIPIIGDARSFEKAIRKSIKGTDHLNSRMGRFAKAVAVAGVAAAGAATTFAVGFGIHAVKLAASLEQSMYRVNRVFGKSAGIIRAYSKTTAGALGINRDQALEFAGSLGLVMRNLGIGQKRAALMSRALVTRASDVALLNKAKPEDVISGFQRGLTGMTRGLKKYGIVVDQTSIKNEAIRSGIADMVVSSGDVQKAQVAVTKAIKDQQEAIKKYGGTSFQAQQATANLTYQQEKLTKAIGGKMPQLTPLQKLLATYNLIFQKSATAAGSSKKRLGAWEQVWKRIHAEVHDLKEEFGLGLLPVVRKVAQVMANKLADPRFREFVRHLGHEVGINLRNALVGIGQWFKANWPGIKSFLRSAAALAARLADKVQALYGGLVKIGKFIGKFGFIPHALDFGSTNLEKAALANAYSKATPAQRRAFEAAGVQVQGDIHVHGVDNPKALAEAIHRHAKKKAQQTRGHGHPHFP